MDRVNLSVYVEQVNHEADSAIVGKWEENEELALNNVIDPNTEFKSAVSEKSTASLIPSHSCDLIRKSKELEERNMLTEQQTLEHNNLTEELIQQLRSDCLNRELEETLEGFKTRQKRSRSECSPSHA
jgi:hypothetical protein